jgi:hypothetical protein
MKLNICLIPMLAVAAAASVATTRNAPAAEVPHIDLVEWAPPSIGSVGDDPFGKLVKYGYALFTDTANQIGPVAVDRPNGSQRAVSPARTATSRLAPSPTRCR